jgi:superoxide dismutase
MRRREVFQPTPLAVLNMFESAYLGDYGVWDRGLYARDWFKRLDWGKVEKRSNLM